MKLSDLSSQPVFVNAGLLLVAGGAVWYSGRRLAQLADQLTTRTSVTHVLAGALLLGGATSLPEVATTVTASALGNAPLAVNNLFGGVAMQLAVLALIDILFVRRGPLTFFSPDPVLLLGGVLLILQVAVAIAAIAAGDVNLIGGIGGWPIVLAAAYGGSLFFMNRFADRDSWTPSRVPRAVEDQADEEEGQQTSSEQRRLVVIAGLFGLHCLAVLVGGMAVSAAADALAKQTAIGSGFIGATLVALTTSLPEISTTAGAVRLGAYTMAISNIFGTNSLELALLLPADVAFREGSVINAVGDSSVLMGAVAIVMTALYLWGLLERREKSVWGMGVDSWLVTAVYVAGLGILLTMST